jgi:hypothetical protein
LIPYPCLVAILLDFYSIGLQDDNKYGIGIGLGLGLVRVRVRVEGES